MALKDEIKSFFKGEALDYKKTLEKYSRDASIFKIKPKLVVFPRDTEDIKNLVLFINKTQEKNICISPRSAGTDMTGGPLGESIILEMEKYFNKIKKIGSDYAITEPGVYYRDFEKETLKHNLLLPSYPASREICTVGGMIANNSGGEKSLVYGKTENYIKQLKVMLSDGNEYTINALTRPELDEKMRQDDFEGRIYKAMFALVDQNYDLLKSAKPDVSKNSAGYYLWNVWDKKTFDLTKLFAGSQGTLGIITEATLRLVKPKSHSKLLITFIYSFDSLANIINTVLEYRPESFESYDDNTLKFAIRYIMEIVRYFKTKNLFSLGWQFLPELWMGLTGGLPKLILMAEFTGDSEKEVDKNIYAAQAALEKFKLKTRVTKTEEEAKKYWVIRRESFNLLRHHMKEKRTAPFIDDIIVHPEQLKDFLPKLQEILNRYNLLYTIAGHIGNGNFHIIPLMDFRDPKFKQTITELSKEVFGLVISFRGSITAEHNDGIIRSPFLEQMYGSEVFRLFEKTKTIFDPNNIFNPGKKVGATLDYAENHLDRS